MLYNLYLRVVDIRPAFACSRLQCRLSLQGTFGHQYTTIKKNAPHAFKQYYGRYDLRSFNKHI